VIVCAHGSVPGSRYSDAPNSARAWAVGGLAAAGTAPTMTAIEHASASRRHVVAMLARRLEHGRDGWAPRTSSGRLASARSVVTPAAATGRAGEWAKQRNIMSSSCR